MDTTEKIEKFREFFQDYYYESLIKAVSEEKGHIIIDFNILSEFNVVIAEDMLINPEDTILCAELSITQFDLGDSPPKLKLRIKNLPKSSRCLIGDIRIKLLNNLIIFDGHLLRKSKVLPQVTECIFECPMCGNTKKIMQVTEQLKEPSQCGCGRKGQFNLLDKKLIDVQSLVVQEKQEELEGAQQPQTIHVLLKEDLVVPHMSKKLNPGSHVDIIGIVKEVPIILRSGGKSTSFDLVVEANNIKTRGETFEDIIVSKEDEKQIKKASKNNPIKLMSEAIAPTIYGHNTLKQAIALQLVGGVKKILQDGREVRGVSHILIIGDPGSGKTALLKFLTKLAPKWQYISGGGGTSGRGISAAVVKDEILKTWTLDAGAAVLANNGMLFFDELDKMEKEERWAIHEIMESQSFTIHKAGINATLMAKVTILAAANPKLGRFDHYEDLGPQINLEPTLVNRFDLLFPFKDIPDEEEDAKLSKHILMSHRKKLKLDKKVKTNPFMDNTFFKKYVAYSKRNIIPEFTDEAEEVILKFYNKLRQKGRVEEGKVRSIPINPRYLEGMIRLAESSAKVRLSQKAEKIDAEIAVGIINYCLTQFGFDPDTGTFDIDKISGEISSSKRDKYNIIKDILKEFKKTIGDKIPLDDVIFEANQRDISKSDAEEAIEKIRKMGDIIEPKRGFIQLLE